MARNNSGYHFATWTTLIEESQIRALLKYNVKYYFAGGKPGIMPTEIWSILLNLLHSHSNSYEIYKCFNECLYFYCLKKGYTENQMQLLDRYKNDIHSQLLF